MNRDDPAGADYHPLARRQTPENHLKRAAKAPFGSDAERYHLAAATAEALARIAAALEARP